MRKTLVAYFSASGTTAGVAKDLASAIHADLHKIIEGRILNSASELKRREASL